MPRPRAVDRLGLTNNEAGFSDGAGAAGDPADIVELVQDLGDGDKGGGLIAIVSVDPRQHVARPAGCEAAVHRVIEAVVLLARKGEFDLLAACRQPRFQEAAPANELLERPIGRAAILNMITDAEGAGLRQHAEDRFGTRVWVPLLIFLPVCLADGEAIGQSCLEGGALWARSSPTILKRRRSPNNLIDHNLICE
jgi:hypothetical protein